MNIVRVGIIAAISLVVPLSSAAAQNVVWETTRIQGEGKSALCSESSVFTSYAGNSVAFVFTKFGVNLSSGASHQPNAEFGACRIQSRLTIPQGYYLAGLRQTTIAGVVKTTDARGEIRTRLDAKSVISEKIETRVEFAPADEMNEPMLLLNGGFDASQSAVKSMCKLSASAPLSMNFEFRASIKGQRKREGSAVTIFIDSNDVQLNLGARLAQCR